MDRVKGDFAETVLRSSRATIGNDIRDRVDASARKDARPPRPGLFSQLKIERTEPRRKRKTKCANGNRPPGYP